MGRKIIMHNVFDVCNYFIKKALEEKIDEKLSDEVTHLRLQKLLYFAQSAHLAILNKKLFSDEILAWTYGPVIEKVYHYYKKYRNKPLKTKGNNTHKFSESTQKILDGIWDFFKKYSTSELVYISHQHDPWKKASQTKNKIMDCKLIKDYYKGIFIFQDAKI